MAIKTKDELHLQNNEKITHNLNEEITGPIMHDHLADIIDSSVNNNEELVLSIIRVPAGETNYSSRINKNFFDYGKGSEESAKHSEHYNEIYFDIINGTNKILNKGTFAHYDNLVTYLNTLTNVGIIIKVYFLIGYPEFNNIYAKNQSYQYLKGNIADYKNRVKTAYGGYWSDLVANVSQNLTSPPFANIPDNNILAEKSLWFTRTNNNIYSGLAFNKRVFYIEKSGITGERYVWDDANGTYISLFDAINKTSHAKVEGYFIRSAVCEINDNQGAFQNQKLLRKLKDFVSPSFIRMYLIQMRIGRSKYYSYIAKPIGQDMFLTSYLCQGNYDLYAYYEGGLRKPFIRKLASEYVNTESNNIGWKVLKDEIILHSFSSANIKKTHTQMMILI